MRDRLDCLRYQAPLKTVFHSPEHLQLEWQQGVNDLGLWLQSPELPWQHRLVFVCPGSLPGNMPGSDVPDMLHRPFSHRPAG